MNKLRNILNWTGNNPILLCNIEEKSEKVLKVTSLFIDTLKEVSTRNGGINILCNNAGIMDNVEWHEMINVNLVGLQQIRCMGMDVGRRIRWTDGWMDR